jgi:hypothetical protein
MPANVVVRLASGEQHQYSIKLHITEVEIGHLRRSAQHDRDNHKIKDDLIGCHQDDVVLHR